MLMQHAQTSILADQGTAEQIIASCTANCVPMQKKQLLHEFSAKTILHALDMAVSTLHKANRQVDLQRQST